MLTFQLVEATAAKSEVAEKDVEKVILALTDVLREALTRKGESVTVRNLGTFKMVPDKEVEGQKHLIFTSLL